MLASLLVCSSQPEVSCDSNRLYLLRVSGRRRCACPVLVRSTSRSFTANHFRHDALRHSKYAVTCGALLVGSHSM
ncbi:hypothetical protein EJ03DRAFT_117240 [Teratosphaeria nubilosa]|uniref:Uncharacterized protein n=1 Tax=Teratosphaeria nubilosa TaxID=161662 RepID=A0A6G1L7F2_9PEZI|nr:hypothetical protein EJ03DRAFT_117240 [Teratosphaeria nubilosa]